MNEKQLQQPDLLQLQSASALEHLTVNRRGLQLPQYHFWLFLVFFKNMGQRMRFRHLWDVYCSCATIFVTSPSFFSTFTWCLGLFSIQSRLGCEEDRHVGTRKDLVFSLPWPVPVRAPCTVTQRCSTKLLWSPPPIWALRSSKLLSLPYIRFALFEKYEKTIASSLSRAQEKQP